MTGREMYEFLQAQGPGFFSVHWERQTREIRQAFRELADTIQERQREAVYAATAGEDI